mgnify:FL=1
MAIGFGVSSSRWADIHLDKETEHAAALAAVAFLKQVSQTAQRALTLPVASALQEQLSVGFESFNPKHLDFILATVASGEVRIATRAGAVKAEETQIPGLWRLEENGRQRFVFASLPRVVLEAVQEGAYPLVVPETAPEGVFSSPAILKELASAQTTCNIDVLDFNPPHMVELTRQPVEKADMQWMKSILGSGDTHVWLSGFANARMQSTRYKAIWRSTILNKAGKTLLDSFVVTLIPPEVPTNPEEFSDSVTACRELIEWLEGDLERGVL